MTNNPLQQNKYISLIQNYNLKQINIYSLNKLNRLQLLQLLYLLQQQNNNLKLYNNIPKTQLSNIKSIHNSIGYVSNQTVTNSNQYVTIPLINKLYSQSPSNNHTHNHHQPNHNINPTNQIQSQIKQLQSQLAQLSTITQFYSQHKNQLYYHNQIKNNTKLIQSQIYQHQSQLSNMQNNLKLLQNRLHYLQQIINQTQTQTAKKEVLNRLQLQSTSIVPSNQPNTVTNTLSFSNTQNKNNLNKNYNPASNIDNKQQTQINNQKQIQSSSVSQQSNQSNKQLNLILQQLYHKVKTIINNDSNQ